MKRIAIVILNWNGEAMLRQYVPTLLRYSAGQADLIVADNASTDGSVPMLRSTFPEVRVISLEKNWGFADGYNHALAQVDAEFLLLLNSDVEVTAGWLTPLLDFMDSHPDAAACQPKLRAEYQRDMLEYAGACGGFIDRYGYPFCRGRLFETVEKDEGQYDTPMPVFWATGAALLIRQADWKASGGLDGRFFAHQEEIDLCWRLQLMGRKVYCVPQSVVYHVGGGTLPKSNPAKTRLNFRNNLLMLYKNLPDAELRHVMRWRCLLDYVAALEMLILGRSWGDFRAAIQGRREFRQLLPVYRALRRDVQQKARCTELPGRKAYSLLWQYYIKGRKTFSALPD